MVEHIYSKDFNVKFETKVSSKGPYINVRYDFDYITFAFNYVGYWALVELFFSLSHNIVSLLDYFVVFEIPAEANVNDGAVTFWFLNPLWRPKSDVNQRPAAQRKDKNLGAAKVKSLQKLDSNDGKDEAEKAPGQSMKLNATIPGTEAVGE